VHFAPALDAPLPSAHENDMVVRWWWTVRWLGCVVAVLLSPTRTMAADAADVSAGIESYHDVTLENGLRVVIAVDHRAPQVAMRIEYAVGDALDPPAQRGLAQLIGAMLPKLWTRHLRSDERPRLLQAAGFKFEEPTVEVGVDETSLMLQVPAEALELALWLEADRMGFAADSISQSTLQRAMARSQAAVDRAFNEGDAFLAYHAALGATHPYGALDRPSNLSQLQAAVVAERVRRYYNPASAVLVLVGDVDANSAEQAVRRLFGPLASAPLSPLPKVSRGTSSRLLSMSAAVPAQFSALVWETPAFLAPDDRALDVIATVLTRRLTARKLCARVGVGQRSRRLASVFVASCGGPTTSSDTWRTALAEELAALAESRVPAVEIEAAAQQWVVVTGERSDDLVGRAAMIASSVAGGGKPQIIPVTFKDYAGTSVSQVAATVRRHLLREADGKIEVAPTGGLSRTLSQAADSAAMFKVAAEARPSLMARVMVWPRPPANTAAHRFLPPTGPSETFDNGDQLRFVERSGVGIAIARVHVPWPTTGLSTAAASVLAELLAKSPVDGHSLEETLRLLGAELTVDSSAEELAVGVKAPAGRVSAALEALASVLASVQLPRDAFDAAKLGSRVWLRTQRDSWGWYWNALGSSAPNTRYEYLSASARKSALARLKLSDVTRLWRVMALQPRAIDLVGPFDNQAARALGAKLARPRGGPLPPAAAKPRIFRPGVYVFDRLPPEKGGAEDATSARLDVCVLWPLPPWATSGHYPAHLMSWFFRADIQDGLAARFSEQGASFPAYWNSNTVLTRDGDFLRYSFHAPIDQVAPALEGLKQHLARLGEGRFSTLDFANAIAAERQFQIRQSLSGQTLSSGLYRAATHDKQGNEAFDIALQVERVTPKALGELAKTLTLQAATIGITGPAGPVTESLKKLNLKPTTITKLETVAGAP
jgi:zinc protease